jgi:hypothetical protein
MIESTLNPNQSQNEPKPSDQIQTDTNIAWAFKKWTSWLLFFFLSDIAARLMMPWMRTEKISFQLYLLCGLTLFIWRTNPKWLASPPRRDLTSS